LVLYADFDQIGGLRARAPVMIAGVKVGQVGAITLDESMRAHVKLEIDRKLRLPRDTSAAIQTAGLLGDQFIALEPGADENFLESGEVIAFTTNALSIESAFVVKAMTSPDSRKFSSAPGSRAMNWSPSRPAVWMAADVSRGSLSLRSISSLTWARMDSSSVMAPTWPTLTPAIMTGARAFRPPIWSKSA